MKPIEKLMELPAKWTTLPNVTPFCADELRDTLDAARKGANE